MCNRNNQFTKAIVNQLVNFIFKNVVGFKKYTYLFDKSYH